MASIYRDAVIDVSADTAWAALQDVGAADRPFAGVLTGCTLEGDVRTVTFANGMVAKERIVTVDDGHRRVVYSTLNEVFLHHSASMRIVPMGERQCRFIWISDVLPEQAAERIAPLVDAGCLAIKKNLESGKAESSMPHVASPS
ncbi:SRPBCC family protein [Edaphobacter sp.]|uniref:SRPBCC family protein n=1 Tax=Edaphobacter sp. TaxID=1934404 RepID=UPI002DBB7B13|nr:SRPBCC family protein [Edaphobacter sp.]HEU5342179.1 SRPBCC family protein [Edaphobacter sp.]